MTEELLPFDVKYCPKCRCCTEPTIGWKVQVGTEYQEAISEADSCEACAPSRPEHLLRECLRCGYVWYERTADADKADPV